MKTLRLLKVFVAALALTGLFGFVHATLADAGTQKNGKGSTAAATNAPSAELPVPVAVFDLTNKVVKDPFFPNTVRVPVPVPVTVTNVSLSASCFVLKALSGTSDQRLALINNRTLATGENAEVTTTQCGKIKIVCVQIKESSVVIRVGNQADPIEVFLPKSAR